MKWALFCASALLLSACGNSNEVHFNGQCEQQAALAPNGGMMDSVKKDINYYRCMRREADF